MSPSSSTVTKGHFSWHAFLNVWNWKRLLFTGDGFAGARSMDLAMLSLEHETFLQMALCFQRSIWLAASRMRCSLLETLEKHFFASCLSCTCRALPKANLHISIFCACASHPKVASVSSGTKASATLRENLKGHVCLLLLFHEWQNLEFLRGYPNFLNTLSILMIFWNKYGKAITVGMYAQLKQRIMTVIIFFTWSVILRYRNIKCTFTASKWN